MKHHQTVERPRECTLDWCANLVPRAFPLKVGRPTHLQGKSPGNEVVGGQLFGVRLPNSNFNLKTTSNLQNFL